MRIKICGITRPEDAEQALVLGADTIGCIFHPGSTRAVSEKVARAISDVVAESGTLVGLFVNPTAQQVESVLDNIALDVLQFHGRETPDFCEQFRTPYLKAVAMSAAVDLPAINRSYSAARAILLDSEHDGQFGGTGRRFNWNWVGQGLEGRLVLAGGLTPENVGEAIRRVRPVGVDVSSGVEKEKGVKDIGRMRAFVKAAQSALTEGEL